MALYIASCQPDYARYAVAELRAADPHLDQVELLGPGLFRVATARPRTEIAAALRSQPPVFLRHLHPVARELPLCGEEADLRRLAAAAGTLLEALPRGETVAVQVRRLGAEVGYTRYAVKEALEPALAGAGAVPAVQGAAQVLSVTLVGQTAYLGLSTPEENLSDWAGGEVRFSRDELVSRAAFKLLEAFTVTGLAAEAGDTALDLGAAPGGWTQVLLEKGLRVTAVDPAALHPSLQGHPRLTYLQQDAKALELPPESFDLLTCDMNWDPIATARLVARLAPILRPGGAGVLTVKLLAAGHPGRLLREVESILTGGGLRVVRFKQLYHNRDEVTAFLRR